MTMNFSLRSICGVLILALLFTSCKKELSKQLFKAFKTRTFEVEFVLPEITQPMTIDSVSANGEPMNLDSLIRAETKGAYSLDDVNAVYLDEFKLILDSADASSNIANFEKLRLTLKSGDGQHSVPVVADVTIPDEFASERSLPIQDDKDLKPVLSANSLVYLVGVQIRRATHKELKGRLQFRFDVK